MASSREPQARRSRAAHTETSRVLRTIAAAMLSFSALCAAFTFVHTRFPYIQSGADLVAQLKHTLARNGRPFDNSAGTRVMAFGDSRVLAGFIPSVFDRELEAAGIAGARSYNFGLPGDQRFIEDLEAMAARGTAPDVVLLTAPWPARPDSKESLFRFANDDVRIVSRFFPFRGLIRDVAIMAAESRGRPSAFHKKYLENERTVNQVRSDRGYYFIARESHFANDELPPNLTLPTDRPDSVPARDIARGPVFQRLVALLNAHNIRCVFVPVYARAGQWAAPPPINVQSYQAIADQPAIGIVGPDYFLYPNRLFSDITHVNRQGADAYTRAVAALVVPWLKQHPVVK